MDGYVQFWLSFFLPLLKLTCAVGGHGTAIGGMIIDGGTFEWTAGKHPLYDEEDGSYNNLRWGHDLPETLAPIAFILRLRTVLLRNTGACISPDNAWMFLQGIETLPLRMEQHCANSLAVANFLDGHDCVEWVRFPGLADDKNYDLNQKYLGGKGGSMVVFGVRGGRSRRRDCYSAAPPLHLVGVSIGMERGCQQNDSLANG